MAIGRYMRHLLIQLGVLFIAGIGLVGAQTLKMQLQEGANPPVTINDNGPGDGQPAIGVIFFNGPVGSFTVNVVTGISKPVQGSPTHAETDLQVTSVRSGTGTSTLTIRLTDTNFPGPIGASAIVVSAIGGNVIRGSATARAYVDPANNAFGTGGSACTPGVQGPFSGPFSDTASTSCSLNGLFSITTVDTATLGNGGQVGFDHDIGLDVPVCGAIGDFVWHDVDHDGLQDAGEPGINGVTLLLKQGSTVLATTTTGPHPIGSAPGYYQFTNVCKGDYSVEVDASTVPAGFTPTLKDVGADDTIDNDSDGGPVLVTLPTDGSSDQTIDFGFQSPCTGSLGDFVWNDLNQNGIQDAGEPGIPGVTIHLVEGNQTTVTGAGGLYKFTGLCAGTYTVEVTGPPAGMTPSPTGATTPDKDSNPSPTFATLVGDSDSDLTLDFGYFKPCTGAIGDFVWNDLNRNGIQDAGEPGIQGVTVYLKNGAGTILLATDVTDVNGFYEFVGLCGGDYLVVVEPASIPPTLTPSPTGATTPDKDSNGSPAAVTLPPDTVDHTIDFGYMPPCAGSIGDFVWNDLDVDGIQDAGEPGISGVSVELRRPDNSLIAVTTTDGSGLYKFQGLCKGDYKVVVIPPAGYLASPTGAGSDQTKDSNPNPSLVTLPTDFSNDLTIDFGFFQPAAIGDFVWHDLNGNGVQDLGELGIPGVTVSLFTCASAPVAAMVTNGSGLYLFSNLTPGCYKVSFATPGSYTASPANAGGDDAKDSDSVGGTTGNYTLAAGETNLTVDAGFYKPASLGDFVWNDLNANGTQDAGEPGIGGVTVTLYPCGSSVAITSMPTNGSGLYLFTNLAPGCYYVKFATPAGFVASPPNVGSDTTDSDSVGGVTGNYTLASGDTDLTVDAGFYQPMQTGMIAPTQTTCSDYINGTAAALGQINYSLNGSVIAQNVNPGVFFFYSKITTTVPNQVVTVSQSNTSSNGAALFSVHQGQALLYTANCASRTAGTVIGVHDSGAQFTVATPGTYIIGIKYNSKSIAGSIAPVPANITYNFATSLGGTTGGSVLLKKQ